MLSKECLQIAVLMSGVNALGARYLQFQRMAVRILVGKVSFLHTHQNARRRNDHLRQSKRLPLTHAVHVNTMSLTSVKVFSAKMRKYREYFRHLESRR